METAEEAREALQQPQPALNDNSTAASQHVAMAMAGCKSKSTS